MGNDHHNIYEKIGNLFYSIATGQHIRPLEVGQLKSLTRKNWFRNLTDSFVCLDVYEFEKGLFFEDHSHDIIHDVTFARLRNFKNVLITSHQAFLTSEAIEEIAKTTIGNLDCWQDGIRCENELTFDIRENDSKNKSESKVAHSL